VLNTSVGSQEVDLSVNKTHKFTKPTEPAKKNQFSLAELMVCEFPPQVFVVDGLLPAGLTMIFGAPKIGKSWFTLDLALSVASGRSFLDRTTDQGAVLYLALEDTPRRLQNRLQLMADDIDWATVSLDLWTEAQTIDAGGLAGIEAWLKSAVNPRLVVIDVWGRFGPRTPTIKNEYDQITQTMQPLQALAANYNAAIVLVHHARKPSGDGSGSGDVFDQAIGSRALTSNMDCTIALTRTRMQQDAVLNLTGRDLEETSINVAFDKKSCRWIETDTSFRPALHFEQQQVFDAFISGNVTAMTIAESIGKGRTAVQNHLASLVKNGDLVRSKKGTYCLPDAVPSQDGVLSSDGADMTDWADMAQPAADVAVVSHFA
jgi:biotin operon repressor